MMPNDFVRGCRNHYVNVRLKNGDFYNGILDQSDHILNFVLTSVTLQKFGSNEEIRLDRAMIRGGSIQFISLSSNITDMVKSKRADANYPTNRGGGNQKQRRQNSDYNNNSNNNNNNNNNNRGGRSYGRGQNRGRGGGGYRNNNYNNNNNNNNGKNFVYTPSSQ